MTTTTDPAVEKTNKASKMPFIIGLVLAIGGALGGYLAVNKGLLSEKSTSDAHDNHAVKDIDLGTFAFVEIDPLIISLPENGQRNHLRFAAKLEVPSAFIAEVEAIKPRLIDVLNGYLRAVTLAELEDPTALIRLRSQMLRRLQVVADEGRISGLLIMEFVIS